MKVKGLSSLFIGAAATVALMIGGHFASGHHNVKLPNVPNTPAIHNIWADGDITWCLNSRASNYPNFRNQTRQTLADMSGQSAVGFTEIWQTFESSTQARSGGCEYLLMMPDNDGFCVGGIAAHIFYANWPVVAEFCWRLGFFDWKSAIGHETGHLLGLHEQYVDAGSIGCGNPASVSLMDCGPPQIWQLQPFDLENLKGWLFPPPVQSAGMAYHEGQPFVWFCGGDPDINRSDWVAVMYMDQHSGQFYWSGIWAYSQPGGDGCARMYVYCYPDRIFYLNQQDSVWPEVSWYWWLRNDVEAGRCPPQTQSDPPAVIAPPALGDGGLK